MTPKAIGKTRAALVVTTGTQAVAVITEVTAQAINDGNTERLRITGPAQWDTQIQQHIEETVLECVQRILKKVNITVNGFEISIANLNVSATQNRPIAISGFSADLPIFLAALSAATQVPLPQNMVATGHIADPNGHTRLVHHLPEKIEAAAQQGITHFIHPALDTDPSLENLTPRELDRIREKRFQHQNHMRIQSIHDIADLIETTIDPDDIAIAALETGYYQDQASLSTNGTPIDKTVNLILMDHRKRFWNTLEHAYLEGNTERSRRTLEAFITHQTYTGQYPKNFGADLHSLILSLPPLIRQKENSTTLSVDQASRIAQLATHENHDDLKHIFEIAAGKISESTWPIIKEMQTNQGTDDADRLLNQILFEISDENLAKEVGNHYDHARNTYRLEKITAENEEEFHNTITAFYLHLMRHLHHHIVVTDLEQAATQAIPTLDQAYQNQGGIRAATQEALHPTHGGLRTILDTLTNHLKHQHIHDYRTTRLTQAINPLDHQLKITLTKKILDRLGDSLPRHLHNAPPEQYANHLTELLQTLADNIGGIAAYLKRV